MKKIANLISIVLHPLLMPTIGIFLIFQSGTFLSYIPENIQRILIWIIAVITLFVPLFMVPFYWFKKIIHSYRMDTITERNIPFFITSILFLFGYFYIKQLNAPPTIQLYILSVFIVSLIVSIVTLFWKISAHMAGIGGVIGLIIVFVLKYMADMNHFLLLFIVLSGLIGTSRLYLNDHKPAQIYTGLVLGIMCVPFTFYVFG